MLFLASRRSASPLVQFTGPFTTTSASSPVTSSTRTINRACTLVFVSLGGTSGGTPQYSKNGGAFTGIVENDTLAMTAGDTLALRCTIGTIGQTSILSILNNATSARIEDVVLTRS